MLLTTLIKTKEELNEWYARWGRYAVYSNLGSNFRDLEEFPCMIVWQFTGIQVIASVVFPKDFQ